MFHGSDNGEKTLRTVRDTRCRRGWAAIVPLVMALVGTAWAGSWLPLAKDGEHDPSDPGLRLLQEPAAALSELPPTRDTVGNEVDWIKALEQHDIHPRSRILQGGKKPFVFNLDVIMKKTGAMPMVRFSHKAHTEWMTCGMCHDALFKQKAGATPGVNMHAILHGKKCGRCHAAVAFPLTECKRCHSVLRK